MTFAERVRALEPLGFTPRQTRFMATVALHSGYCLRRQYSSFANVCYGKNVCDFFDELVARKIAARFTRRADRGLIYHLQARSLYRAIGQDDNRNRRAASAALVARKLMVLDYVLARPDLDWLATEADKIELFEKRWAVPTADLPQHVFTAAWANTAVTTRYFTDKLPIAVAGEPPVAYFVYLATDATGRGFEKFLESHAGLFAWLPRWTVVAVGPSLGAIDACHAVFGRQVRAPRPPVAAGVEDLRWFFSTRQTIDDGELARLSVAAIDRFRTLRQRFGGATFESLYAEWRRHGDSALATWVAPAAPAGQSNGKLVTERLKYDYSQFGSLPGIA